MKTENTGLRAIGEKTSVRTVMLNALYFLSQKIGSLQDLATKEAGALKP